METKTAKSWKITGLRRDNRDITDEVKNRSGDVDSKNFDPDTTPQEWAALEIIYEGITTGHFEAGKEYTISFELDGKYSYDIEVGD